MLLNEIYELREEDAAEELLKKMGWEYHSSKIGVKELHKRTISIIKTCREIELEERTEFIGKINFSAWNRDDREYGKTFDRIVLSDGRKSFTVIHNMSGAGARYRIFKTGYAEPIEKIRSMKETSPDRRFIF